MHKSNHKDLILMNLLKILLDFCVNKPLDSLSIAYHFFVANFEFSLSEPVNKFTIFCVSIIYMIGAEFYEKLKVVFCDFLIIKNIVAP